MDIRNDTAGISSPIIDGLPKSKYSISDSTLNKVIQLEENKELQKSIKEYKTVIQALELVDNDCKIIFEEIYQKNKYKWDIIDDNGLSERTFARRKSNLIYAVHNEIKKVGIKLA